VNNKKTRFVLSNREELYDQLEQLDGRKKELENALQALQQSITSTDIRPTNPQPITIPARSQHIPKVPQEYNPQPTSTDVDDSFVDAFGKSNRTLSVSSHTSC
jgi:hypothetical protein